MPRAEFEKALQELHEQLLKMGATIEHSMDLMIKALETGSSELATEVIERDDIIDDLEVSIETACLDMIIKQQPVASDLREITSILKMITDLERISDQCADICEYVLKLTGEQMPEYMRLIIKMAQHVKQMISATIDSYVHQDADKAIQTAKSDDVADNYFEQITGEIIQSMQGDPALRRIGIYLLLIAKYLERIGDHTTNVCEWVAYRITGDHQLYN